jgi:hypothetical protein
MLKIADARMRDHRRPYRAVNGQTKKQEKKARRYQRTSLAYVTYIFKRISKFLCTALETRGFGHIQRRELS